MPFVHVRPGQPLKAGQAIEVLRDKTETLQLNFREKLAILCRFSWKKSCSLNYCSSQVWHHRVLPNTIVYFIGKVLDAVLSFSAFYC